MQQLVIVFRQSNRNFRSSLIIQLGLVMLSAKFQGSNCRQLRVQWFLSGIVRSTNWSSPIDILTDPAISSSDVFYLMARHNNKWSLIFGICKLADFTTTLETNNSIVFSCRRCRQLTVNNWSRVFLLFLDVTFTSPLQPSFVTQAAREPCTAVFRAEEWKLGYFDECCHSNGILFIPFALGTRAGLSEHANSFTLELTKHHADYNFSA